MGNNNLQRKYSLRKFKGVGLASAVIALCFANGTVSADVSSGAELVSDTTKVESTKSVTFKDDTDKSKTVKVDAVLEKGTVEPTKANSNTGDVDGNDTLNFKSEATVNYKLDSDKSDLKPAETVKVGTGTVTTPYDKKGLSYDTDGKDYRESTVAKTGDAVTEATGKKDTVEVNGKVYEYVRSEVKDAEKVTYEKTNFNDIEAKVSPEGMHNKLGEIDYTKTTGKVYLVEETADGQYGKFVVVNGVASDEDAVKKWKAGQTDAKDFTKANVTLEKGDTILVLDKDTYAVGEGKERVKKTAIQRTESEPIPPVDVTATFDGNQLLNDGNVYNSTIQKETSKITIKDAGQDATVGSVDDVNKEVDNVTLLKFDTSNKLEGKTLTAYDNNNSRNVAFKVLAEVNSVNTQTAVLSDYLKDINSTYYSIVKFFKSYASESEGSKELINSKEEALNNYIQETVDYIKQNDIKFGIVDNKLVFYNSDEQKISALKNKIENTKTVLDGLTSKISGSSSSENILPRTEITYTGELTYNSNAEKLLSGNLTVNYKEASYGSGGEVVTKTVVSDEEMELKKLNFKGKVTINQNQNLIELVRSSSEEKNNQEVETSSTITYSKKEVISPIRAYKVYGDEKAEVTHYYKEQVPKEIINELKGTVVMKYVDQNGNQLAEDTILKDNVTVAQVKTVEKDGKQVEVSRDTVSVEYSANPQKELTVDGVKFKLKGILPAGDKFKNTVEEKGLVQEGTTTLVYEYRLSMDAETVEIPEYNGGATPLDPPIVEIPEYEGGVVPIDPPVVEIPEYKGGVAPIDPPVVEIPEYEGGVGMIDPPVVEIPEYEGGVVPIDPPVVEIPEYKLPEEPTPQPDPTPNRNPQPKEEPKLEQPKKEEPKKNLPKEELKREELKQKDSTPIPSKEERNHHNSTPVNNVEELPQTGTGNEFAIFGAAASSILAGLGLVVPSLKKED